MNRQGREVSNYLGRRVGNYRVLRFLGAGAFADVYLGEHVYLRTSVALKFLHICLPSEADEYFLSEARTVSQLIHPHILRVLDFGMEEEIPFLVMDYAPGGTLRERYPIGSRLPLAAIVSYVSDIASAAQYVHEHGLMHLDIKPENLLVGRHNEILLCDFGIARLISPINVTHITKPFGTLGYMAPEQMWGRPCPASDQYALAVIVYEWLSGNTLFSGSDTEVACQHLFATPASLSAQHADIPFAVEQVVLKALTKDPTDRFASIASFADILAQESIPSTTQSPVALSLPMAFPITPTSPGSPQQPYHSDVHFQNVPATLTPLVGREQQVQAVSALLRRPEVRLVTITGTGGIGKTRLAQQVGVTLIEQFTHGVCFVPLASIRDPNLLISTIAHVLGRYQVGDRPPYEDLKEFLQNKHLLLVLDNFEQVLPAASTLTTLLEDCPQLKILVTSRIVLHSQGEYEFSVPPLALPDLGHLPTRDELAHVSAIALFVQRAQALKPDFQLTDHNAQVIAEICVRLDGLPLAMELAVARLKLLSPQSLLSRLEHRLTLLTAGAQNAPPRQQALRSTLDWSFDLLTPEEQRIFRRLSVFVGGCTLEAAEAVCTEPGDLTTPTIDLLSSLLDKSLLSQSEQSTGETRLSLLETVREYAQEHLDRAGERTRMQQAHAEYFLAFAERSEPELYQHQQSLWMKRLDQEVENLRAALTWLLSQQQAEPLLRLAGALAWFWYWRGHMQEGVSWMEKILHAYGQVIAVPSRSKLLSAMGLFAGFFGQQERALPLCQEALLPCLEDGNLRQYTQASWMLVHLYLESGDIAAAQAQAEEALAITQQFGDRWAEANALIPLGAVALAQGEYARAQTLIEQNRALCREVGDLYMCTWSLVRLAEVVLAQREEAKARNLLAEAYSLSLEARDTWPKRLYLFGQIALRQGDSYRARILVEEGLKFHQYLGDQRGILHASFLLAQAAYLEQNEVVVRSMIRQCLQIARALGDEASLVINMEDWASSVASQEGWQWAARLWGVVDQLCEVTWMPLAASKQARREQLMKQTQSLLTMETLLALKAEGREMTENL